MASNGLVRAPALVGVSRAPELSHEGCTYEWRTSHVRSSRSEALVGWQCERAVTGLLVQRSTYLEPTGRAAQSW